MSALNPPSAPPVLLLDGDASYPPEILGHKGHGIGSYHTAWFELHEELILAAGLTRECEAKSGDAQ